MSKAKPPLFVYTFDYKGRSLGATATVLAFNEEEGRRMIEAAHLNSFGDTPRLSSPGEIFIPGAQILVSDDGDY